MHAEDMNYWKTSKSNESTWLDRAIKQIEDKAHGRDPKTGAAALMLQFQIGEEYFKIVWPILESRAGNLKSATVQAATLMFHDVKARCMTAKILGARTAFFAYYMLPDGRSASEVNNEQAAQLFDGMAKKRLGEEVGRWIKKS
jgi:hypothetical protein